MSQLPTRRLNRTIHRAAIRAEGRKGGIRCSGARGSGKSTLLGIIGHGDAVSGLPTILFETQGGLVSYFLWLAVQLDPLGQERFLARIVYCDMSVSHGYTTDWPLLYQLPGDTLHDVAQRFPEIITRLHPQLSNAQILGAGHFERVATYASMVLFALGQQLTHAPQLLADPQRYRGQLEQLAATNSQTRQAAEYFLHRYPALSPNERENHVMTFERMLGPFVLNPKFQAMFGARRPTVDWERVDRDGSIVILDFQDIRRTQEISFKLRWCFSHLWEYLKVRDRTRGTPISVILDELSFLLSSGIGSDEVLARDLNNFINKDMRYRNVWLTLAHQELDHLPESIQNTLLGLGTQIIGATSNKASAMKLAEQYLDYDPLMVKRLIPVWMSDMVGPYVVDRTAELYSLDEQKELLARKFRRLAPFQFLMAASEKEGHLPSYLQPINIKRAVELIGFPDQDDERRLARGRTNLTKRSGHPILETEAASDQQLQPASSATANNGRVPAMTSPNNLADERLQTVKSQAEALPPYAPVQMSEDEVRQRFPGLFAEKPKKVKARRSKKGRSEAEAL